MQNVLKHVLQWSTNILQTPSSHFDNIKNLISISLNNRPVSYFRQETVTSSSAGAAVHDEPWPLLRLLATGPDPVTFITNF
jgi:hypothetical protein